MWFILIFVFFVPVICEYDKESSTNSVNSNHFKSTFHILNNTLFNEELTKDLPPTMVDFIMAFKDPKSDQLPLYLRRNDHNEEIVTAYDFIIDLTRPTDIFQGLKAYPLIFPRGKEVYDNKINDQQSQSRFMVNVVGRYNVGKTYVLKLLANMNLGHSFTERTNGISVALPSSAVTHNAPMALIDTAGTRTPVIFDNNDFHYRSYERQVSDSFIQEIAFNSADIFVLVVNQLTLDDQLYLKALYKRLQDKGLRPNDIKQQLLIVHNYFNLHLISEIEQVEKSELIGMFNAKKQPQGFWLSKDFKHFILANSNGEAGKKYNDRTIEQLQIMIKGSHTGLEKDVLKKIIKETEKLLSKFLVDQTSNSNTHDENINSNIFQRTSNFILRLFYDPKNTKENLKIENKHKINIQLDIEKWESDVDHKVPLWFICSQEPLSENIVLSKNLKFNEDGSVYIDYSSDFIPDLHVAQLNEQGDIQIRIECPSCSPKYKIQVRGSSLFISNEKPMESMIKDYLNTRRAGKFELEVPVGNFEKDRTFDYKSITTDFKDGVMTITVPVMEDITVINTEL
ncbi:unnamed protein product [Rotaria sp. Silwood2]|nr:unnamed protein product [Rotaria sp. Silwood2]CAF3923969.1 unnamed protein product [Rotaria sp. Silwood2]CAF3962375.1 unnamed protein product [Rotaria sp. Silwood2]